MRVKLGNECGFAAPTVDWRRTLSGPRGALQLSVAKFTVLEGRMRELFHLLRCVGLNLVTHPPACLTRRIWPPSPAPFDFGFDICGVRKSEIAQYLGTYMVT